ncbi:MAG: SUMF1/EgtB/PvdO family nonheme iron enzyme [Anaerolineae bacterium]|nr:SUMF1/EgtB/PvdO family nonheme iron enzyme [Anaerolineae bacterium]
MWGRRGARVLRGGSWNNNNENNLRAAYRNRNNPANENNNNGFRCARPCSMPALSRNAARSRTRWLAWSKSAGCSRPGRRANTRQRRRFW